MKFGLFVGAKIGSRHLDGSQAGDSLGLNSFLDYVKTAEDNGFHNLFVVEHHFTGVGQVSASLGLLTYVAAKTTHLRLGTAVMVLPWHNPALLAEQVATLDLLCDGRFDFGIGKGYRPDEFKRFCMPIEEAQGRYDECVDFLKKAWTSNGRFSFEGRYHRYEDIVVEPEPVQRPHPPFWMAAGSLASAQRAGESGFSMLLDQVIPVDVIEERVVTYRKARAEAGLDPLGGQVCLARGFRLVADDAAAEVVRRETGTWLERVSALKSLGNGDGTPEQRIDAYVNSRVPLVGTVDDIIDRLKDVRAAGIDHVILNDMSGSCDALRQFAAEIAPAFQAASDSADEVTAQMAGIAA